MSFTTTVPAHHDDRHELDDGPHARESVVLLFHIPEENIAAGVYTWVNAASEAGWSACIFNGAPDGGALQAGGDGIPVPREMGFSDWRVGSIVWKNLEPLRTGQLSYSHDEVSMDIAFEAMHEPYLYSSAPAGCPSFVAKDRMEQSGRVRGTLRIGDRVIEVDTMGHRDHSWGTRDWRMMQHYKWIEAQTPEAAVHVFEINAKGRRDVYGYVFKDGTLSPVATADFDIVFGDRMVEETVNIAILDEAGRETSLSGTRFADVDLLVSPYATLVDICMAVEIDGERGAGYADLSWPPDYLEHMRSFG